MRRLLFVFVLSGCLFPAFGQQKAMYTQYMFNTLAINPAYASIDESLTLTALLRHQWVGFKGAPSTQTISIHSPVGESNTFLGALLINDQIGEVIKETGVYFTISQRVEIGAESYLAVGINGGASSFRADYSENFAQSPESVNDPTFNNSNNIRGNFGLGFMFFSSKYYVGLSSPHFYNKDFSSLNQKVVSGSVKPHYLIQGGALYPLGYDFKFKPNLLIKYVNGSPVQLDLNANILIKETLWLGASCRSFDSFDILASIYITPDLQVGYSYDFTHTQLATIQKGSHEIMLKFRRPVKGRDHNACYF